MENDLNSLTAQEQKYVNDLQMAIANAKNSGSLQEAQIVSDNAAKLNEALINESNRVSDESYQRYQDTLDRNEKTAQAAQELASAMGYVNPYAQYALTPDIMQQLAPYQNDYAAFIQANPNSWLVPYAQNARFQKMLASGNTYANELSNYRTPDYQLTQSQIEAQNALADQRASRSTGTSRSSSSDQNTNYQDAVAQYNGVNGEQMYQELTSDPQSIISQIGSTNYNKLIALAQTKNYAALTAAWATSSPADIVASLTNDEDYYRTRLGDTNYYKMLTEAKKAIAG
jgi:hypothetical protein